METTTIQPAVENTGPAATSETQEQVNDANAVLAKNKELLNELRVAREKAKELEIWKADLELKEKEQKGQLTEVIASLRDENKTLKERMENQVKEASFKKFQNEVSLLANEYGCGDTELLFAAMTKEEMASVEVDDKFNVNKDDAKRLIESIKARKPILFSNSKVNINNVATGFNNRPATEGKNIKEMSADEYKAHILKNFKQ